MRQPDARARRRALVCAWGGWTACAVLALWACQAGAYALPPAALLSGLRGQDTAARTVLLRLRLPRIAGAVLIGAALAVAGGAYQEIFRNALVSPDILGVSAGAGLGASVALTLGMPRAGVQALAFACGLGAALVAVTLARRTRMEETVGLLLCGTMCGAACAALTTLLKYIAEPSQVLPAISFWLMGSLARTDAAALRGAAAPMAVGFALLFLLRRRLGVLALPDDEAYSLGVHPRRTRMLVIVAATLLSASAVCVGGMIGWVGLMAPHLARRASGAHGHRLLPIAAGWGGACLLAVDTLARTLYTMELPLGVCTALLGAPFFLIVMLRTEG